MLVRRCLRLFAGKHEGLTREELTNYKRTPLEEELEQLRTQYKAIKIAKGEPYTESFTDVSTPDFNLFSSEDKFVPWTKYQWAEYIFKWITRKAAIVTVCLFGYTFYVYTFEEVTPQHRFVVTPLISIFSGVKAGIVNTYKMLVDPPSDKLLPDLPKLPPGYPLPKTLVLDLRGTVVSAEYSLGAGFEVMKRPGLTEFLNKMSQMFEVVIFSDEDYQFTHMTAENLDPRHRIFSGRLGRESMCLRGGKLVKDLSYLNRNLKNVIIIEKDLNKVKLQPDNVILLPEFKGDKNDRALIELIPFLEHVAKDQRVKDVREELNKYGHTETGQKYLEYLRTLRDKVTDQQAKGVAGFFTKMGKKRPQQDFTNETPKPPST